MNFLKNEQLKVFFSIILGVLSGLVGVLIFGLSGYMISLSYFNPPFITIILIIVIIKLSGMSKGVFKYFERLYSHEATFQMINRLRVGFLRETLTRGDNMRDVRLIEKLNQYFDEIENYYIRMIYPIITAITIALIIILLSLYIDIKLLIILSLFSLFVLLFIPVLFKRRSTKIYDEKESTESELYLNIYGLIYGYSDLFINKEVDIKRDKIKTLMDKHAKLNKNRQDDVSYIKMYAQILQIIGIALIIMYTNDVLLLPMIILIFINVVEVLIPVMQPISEVQRVRNTVNMLEASTESKETFNNNLAVENLTYRYENSKRDVLKNVTLNINEGEKHVIIGPSGSGKSTLLHQIITKDSSVMPQFLDFYNGTLEDNLTMFDKNDVNHHTLNDYLEYFELKSLKLDDYIYSNAQISAGERKRLHAIRMSLEHKSTWIMDEPTAHLNEKLREKMWQLILKKETLIVVTHDFSHLESFDYIHYLKDGEIIETVTPEGLKSKASKVALIQQGFLQQ
ncbi:ATP-binding cassette domain-containing protein [Nosocomiicoccus ampullae]|uniref:ATP-binding cassette domain-containing protein n=1 Tax=Nosocomiicoccus ampullae TaxID=489910 RepID=UPI001C5FC375|nr:ATP-binding cassette domain-containing protein [Nosocomiicoccus ampullae]QYA48718.1 ATP-binding cassette domain-containing protein [Nosocomiicoccus ampullae]